MSERNLGERARTCCPEQLLNRYAPPHPLALSASCRLTGRAALPSFHVLRAPLPAALDDRGARGELHGSRR